MCYGPRINKDRLIEVTTGLAEPMGGLHDQGSLVEPRNEKVYNLIQRVRDSFKVKPTRFRLQRWSHLDETHLAKRAITDIRYILHHVVETPRQVAIHESAKKTSKQNFWHQHWIWLDCKEQSISAKLGLLWGKSNQEPNTRVV
jgi:hypothetical protein